MKIKKDTLHRFIFENIPVRGILVQLNETWKSLQGRKNYRFDEVDSKALFASNFQHTAPKTQH